MRQISLVAFLQAQNCTTIPAAWRHPEGWTNSYSPEYYQHIGRVLEEGKFDMGFFDDRLACPICTWATTRTRWSTASAA